MSIKYNKYLLNIALVVASIIITVLVVEVSLWLFHIPPYPESVYNVLEPDNENGFRFRPNSKSGRSSWEYDTPVSINSIGIRDYDSVNNNSEPYAFLLGDSFAEGHGVNIEQTIAKRLQERTGKLIANLGLASIGTTQEVNIFRRNLHIFTHRPKYAILLFYVGNDYYDNARFHTYSRIGRFPQIVSNGYLVDDGTSIAQNGRWLIQFDSNNREIRRTTNPAFHPPKGYENRYLDWSKIYNVYAWANTPRNKACQINNAIPGLLDRTYDFDSSVEWKVTKESLEKFILLAKENSIIPIIVIVPSKFQLNPDLLKKAGCDIENLDASRSIDILEKYATRSGIISLNLAKEFSKMPAEDFNRLYYSIDVHLTPFGNEAVANAIANIIK